MAREKVSGILSDLGCEVVCAEDGVEGLTVATHNAGNLDLIVLDIQMPKADGITLLRYLRKVPALARTPVIMLTTQADKETVKTALTHGARDFLRKDATIAHITERLQFHLQAEAAPEAAQGPEDREIQVRDLLTGAVRPARIAGPCVLCHIPESEVSEFLHESGTHQLGLYLAIAAGISELNARYPHLCAGYLIESTSSEVSKHLKQYDLIRWVLFLGRRQEGLSVARVSGLTGLLDNRNVHMICDPIASLDERDQQSVTRMGAVLLEQAGFYQGGALRLLEEHLLPPSRQVGTTVRIRDLIDGTGLAPRRGQTVRLHYCAVRRDREVLVDTLIDRAPVDIAFGDEGLPEGIWQALAEVGRGGRILANMIDPGEEEAAYYTLDVVDVTDL